MSGRSARREGEHVVHALRPDERRVAVVVDREARRALGRVREARPGGVVRGGQRRGRLARVVDAVDLGTLAAAARVGEVDPRLPVRQPHRREREAAAVEREDRLPAARPRRLRSSGSGPAVACAAYTTFGSLGSNFTSLIEPGLRERERCTAVRRRVHARRRCPRAAARSCYLSRCRARPSRVPIRMWLRVAWVDRDPRDRPVVGDRERPGDARPVGAVVGRLVEAEPGLAVAAVVRLAGPDVDRLAGRIVRVDGDRADRVRRDSFGDLLPRRLLSERVLRSARHRRRPRRRRACSPAACTAGRPRAPSRGPTTASP